MEMRELGEFRAAIYEALVAPEKLIAEAIDDPAVAKDPDTWLRIENAFAEINEISGEAYIAARDVRDKV